jgi:hypothetical protein
MEVGMKSWISSVLGWIERAETRDMEKYFAQSTNIADLERRMREGEKKQQGSSYLR